MVFSGKCSKHEMSYIMDRAILWAYHLHRELHEAIRLVNSTPKGWIIDAGWLQILFQDKDLKNYPLGMMSSISWRLIVCLISISNPYLRDQCNIMHSCLLFADRSNPSGFLSELVWCVMCISTAEFLSAGLYPFPQNTEHKHVIPILLFPFLHWLDLSWQQ